jgi:hypothetical protein
MLALELEAEQNRGTRVTTLALARRRPGISEIETIRGPETLGSGVSGLSSRPPQTARERPSSTSGANSSTTAARLAAAFRSLNSAAEGL